MNYLAHAIPFLDYPYLTAGTAVPDWLMVVDRRARVRSKHIEPFLDHSDPVLSAVARGIRQHLADDAHFHDTRAFAELSWGFTVLVRDHLNDPAGMRPRFLGHLLVELFLDALLTTEEPSRLENYYETLDRVDPKQVEEAVGQMATRPAEHLALFIKEFCRQKVLWDYLDDEKLLRRLNQIMHRVDLPLLPDSFPDIFSKIRNDVRHRRSELLEGIPVKVRGEE